MRLDKQFNVTQVESDHEDSADDHGSQDGPQGDGEGETADDAGTPGSN